MICPPVPLQLPRVMGGGGGGGGGGGTFPRTLLKLAES